MEKATFDSFREAFLRSSQGIYSLETIAQMKDDSYSPTIIGYRHTSQRVSEVKDLLTRLNPSAAIGLEITPQGLRWGSDFIRNSREYLATHTPSDPGYKSMVESMKEYRSQSANTELSIWLMENDHEVVALESSQTRRWMKEDEEDFSLYSELFQEFGPLVVKGFLFYKAIRRNKHALQVIEEKRPEVIVSGFAHAFVYDLLLPREERQSYYLPGIEIQSMLHELSTFERVHDLYRRRCFN